MKNKKTWILSLLLPLLIGVVSCGGTNSTSSSTTSTTTSSTDSSTTSLTTSMSSTTTDDYYFDIYNPDGYYDDALYKTGHELKESLRTILSTDHNETTYGDLRYYFVDSDADPDNPGNIILFYCRCSVSGTWDFGNTFNREHIWPQSLGGFKVNNSSTGPGADLHHIRPTDPRVNEIRGNKPFGVRTSEFTTVTYNDHGTNKIAGYECGSCFEPLDEVKGDIARIIMYLIVRYSDLETRFSNRSTTPIVDCSYETLLEWNRLDPVDDLERHRNDFTYSVQNNRNAFIDNPEFADLIWRQ